MSVTKRTSKVVSYNERDDDDDFIPIVDKNRIKKSNGPSIEMKSVAKQKLDEKSAVLSKSEQAIIEIDDDEESTSIESTASVADGNIADQDESLSPKNKRLKHDEDNPNENEEPIKKTAQLSDLPKRNSSIPIGFPTSKITIPSPHVSRLGLSRKSATIKPLHPNLTSRILPE